MGFFGFLFWIAVLWLAIRMWRSYGGCARDRRSINSGWEREELSDQQRYIDVLESRVAELEARLDFTESLVAEKR